MKPNSLFISLSVLAHLLVIDLTYYILNSQITVDFLAILSYNIFWMAIALLIGSRFLKNTEDMQDFDI